MSRFLTKRHSSLVPYVPGEQPKNTDYIKLNTNESPFAPDESVLTAISAQIELLRLYPDPESSVLTDKIASLCGVKPSQVIVTNGSDEALYFAFTAFADSLAFPDITYGFYPVFAQICRIPYEEIPLCDDFSVDAARYVGINKTVVIANPNAPTGLCLELCDIERILQSNPDNVVIIDEAYVDFGAQSAVKLVDKYNNLLVVQTFSKSRSMAGARLGFAIGDEALIADLHTIKDSTNPYNINRLSAAAGYAALCSDGYYKRNAEKIKENRENTKKALRDLGFFVTDSKANFLFAKSDRIEGGKLYEELKSRGVLVRHFNKDRIRDFVRITVGTDEQMRIFIDKIKEILEGRQ